MNLQGPLWRFTGVRPVAWAFFAFLYIPIIVLVALSLAIGIFAEPALTVTQTAASQAIDRAGYIEAVNPEPAPTPAPVVVQEVTP